MPFGEAHALGKRMHGFELTDVIATDAELDHSLAGRTLFPSLRLGQLQHRLSGRVSRAILAIMQGLLAECAGFDLADHTSCDIATDVLR